MSGVETTGFVKKTLTELLSEIETSEKASISPALNTLATSILGQLNGIFADKLRELWDVAEAVYRSQYPDSATGDALDQVCALVGVTRKAADYSIVQLDRMLLDDGTTVPAGSIVSVGADGNQFKTQAEVENTTGFKGKFAIEAKSVDLGPITGYAETIDQIVTPISGWQAKAFTSAGANENYDLDTLQLSLKGDQNLVFNVVTFVGNGLSAQDVADQINAAFAIGIEAWDGGGFVMIASTTDGPGSTINIFGGAANAILQFPTDETKGMNSEDATLGRDTETDVELRLRREESLPLIGAGTVDAIRAKLLELSYVIQCYIFENPTDVEVDGLPPHSFEAVVRGGEEIAEYEQEIAETIWTVKGAGIATVGDIALPVIDSQGFTHTVRYSRPTGVDIYIQAKLKITSDFPTDGVDQVKAGLKALGDEIQVGEDVISLKFKSESLHIAGVLDVLEFYIDTAYPPTNEENIEIDAREIATFELAAIEITTET